MFKFLKLITIIFLINNSYQKSISIQSDDINNNNKILLYQINDEQSIFIVDKLNKISLVNDSTTDLPINHEKAKNEQSKYTLLYSNENYILIGTINKILNISLNDNKIDAINWSLEQSQPQLNQIIGQNKLNDDCDPKQNKYYNPYECNNYIKVGIPIHNDSILISCGTNMKKPYCRKQTKTNTNYFNSQLIQVNKNPKMNTQNIPAYSYASSIYFFHSYTQTQDIYKLTYSIDNDDVKFQDLIRTPNGAIKFPNFRSSFGHNDKVYFFFSESDFSDSNNDISFKTPTSFIGQICSNDMGRTSFTESTKRFLTFKKTILNCYIPDYNEMMHTRYTEIQETTKPFRIENQTDDIFYAVFNLRRANQIDSALCMYKLTNIEQTMYGMFKLNQDKTPYRPMQTCDDYKKMNSIEVDNYYKGITKNSKFQLEQSINQKALFALNNVKFTSIAVDTSFGQSLNDHVIFIGTNDGRVLKLVNNVKNSGLNEPVLVAEYKLFESQVNNIILSTNQFIAVSNELIKTVKFNLMCEKNSDCNSCSSDPYCGWSSGKCIYRPDSVDKCEHIVNNLIQTYMELKEENSDSSNGVCLLFVSILFLILITFILSVIMTLIFIKKYFKLDRRIINKQTKNKYLSFIIDFIEDKENVKFLDNLDQRPKVMNCYEKKPVTVVCNSLRPDSVVGSETMSSTIMYSSSNSPNNLGISSSSKASTINNESFSSIDDHYDSTTELKKTSVNNLNIKKKAYSKEINNNSECVNVTENLLNN